MDLIKHANETNDKRDVKKKEKERCWEKEGKGRSETMNHVVIYKRKVHTFPEVIFVHKRKEPGRLQARPLLTCPLSRFLMPATIRNNIDLVLSILLNY